MRPARILAIVLVVGALVALFVVDDHRVSNGLLAAGLLVHFFDAYRAGGLKNRP